jgi:ABC-type glycerol-3-phosphate transport system substrate-binding protein
VPLILAIKSLAFIWWSEDGVKIYIVAILPPQGSNFNEGIVIQDSLGRLFRTVLNGQQLLLSAINATAATTEVSNIDSKEESLIESDVNNADNDTTFVTSFISYNGNVLMSASKEEMNDHSQELLALNFSTGKISKADAAMAGLVLPLFNKTTTASALPSAFLANSVLRTSDASGTLDSYGSYEVSDDLSSAGILADSFDIVSQSGIYRYEDDALKLLANSSETAIFNPAVQVTDYLAFNNGFYLTGLKNEITGLVPFLYCYTSLNADSTPKQTLRVFTLEDSSDVRQAIALFKNEQPETKVELEIGFTGKGVTYEDALHKLNNDILSGNAPDIMFLDDLPIKEFTNKGVLMDISDVYDELLDSQDLDLEWYFYNVISAFYEVDSNKSNAVCYALPTRFSFPAIFANKELTQKIEDIGSLVSVADEQAGLHSDIPIFAGAPVADTLLAASYSTMFPNDEINVDEVKGFLQACQSISRINSEINHETSPAISSESSSETSSKTSPEISSESSSETSPAISSETSPETSPAISSETSSEISQYAIDTTHESYSSKNGALGTLDLNSSIYLDWGSFTANNGKGIVLQNVDLPMFFGLIQVPIENCEVDFSLKPLAFSSTQFMPQSIIGISSTCANPNIAKDFIRLMLKESQQANSKDSGLPVSVAGFQLTFGAGERVLERKPDADVPTISGVPIIREGDYYDADSPSSEKQKEYIAMLKSLESAVVVDRQVKEILYQQLKRLIDHEITLEEAVFYVEKNVGLYLSARSS